MRYAFLFGISTILCAQTPTTQNAGGPVGAELYKERCAQCHDAPEGRIPPLSALKAKTTAAVYTALTTGVMRTQAEGLSMPQVISLIGYIAPTGDRPPATPIARTCTGNTAFTAGPNPSDWNGFSTSLTNARFQSSGLKSADVPKLKLKWAFNLGEITDARSQPSIVGGRVFIGAANGVVYSLDARTGCTYWGFRTDAQMHSGVTTGDVKGTPAVFFTDLPANVYAVNAATGELLWKAHPETHFAVMGTATPRFYKGVLYQPFSSFEEVVAADPKQQCCTFRGSVVALDAATGSKLWQTYTIAEQPTRHGKEMGPSGAGVWSTPTIDERRGALYVATGDNYSSPASETSDAVIAMDLKTGQLLWSKQLSEADMFNIGCSMPQKTNCDHEPGPDHDFGQPPILVTIGGRQMLVIGQKSGLVHALDPANKGKLLWQTRAGEGGALGGSQWGSASDGRNIYVAISHLQVNLLPDAKASNGLRSSVDPKQGGGLHALDLRTGKILWSAAPKPCPSGRTGCSPAQSAAVTAIPGVVFSGSEDGHLRAYSTSNGSVVWDVDTAREFSAVNGGSAHGGSIDVAGPAIAEGMLFINSGYGQWGGMPGNVLLVVSPDGR
jgi:polyvinyl alcohol dehydrogenase (cytochrome)